MQSKYKACRKIWHGKSRGQARSTSLKGRGDIYAFLGLNGAGKTTTIRALLGMIPSPSEGKVIVLDQARSDGSGPWAKVGYLVGSPGSHIQN
ncbi:MAG: ATP-binding cassette domain-containing protein [Anaerolineales bacterium]|nr:ATP-binding cassette domain-containing protein [Anaerolineales bacterium]